MTKDTIQILTPRLAITLALFFMFMACKKELSVEKGGFLGTAQGELVDSLGNCKNVTIRGDYRVDTQLTNNNFVLVNVNFTAAGKYKIYTDTVNGMWFIDSGFAISTGPSVVKIKGKGTAILPKKTNFVLFFNNTACSFSITPTGTGSGGGGGGGGTGSGTDYFPTTSGSKWIYQYIPKLGGADTFTVIVAPLQVQVPGDTLIYSQFATRFQDTFYFSKNGKGDYFALSTVDFDYTLLFDSVPKGFISYPFLKENANVGDTWQSGEYGEVKLGTGSTAEYGKAKAVFTLVTKNTIPYTIAGKTYTNVINVKREIMFQPKNSTTFRLVIAGNSYYAKGFGLIDQVIGNSPNQQSVSLFETPTIK